MLSSDGAPLPCTHRQGAHSHHRRVEKTSVVWDAARTWRTRGDGLSVRVPQAALDWSPLLLWWHEATGDELVVLLLEQRFQLC